MTIKRKSIMSKEILEKLAEIKSATEAQHEALETKNTEVVANIDAKIEELAKEVTETKAAMAKANLVDNVMDAADKNGVEVKAFIDYIRHGETKSDTMNTLQGADGGYLVPTIIDLEVTKIQREMNVMESWATVKTITNDQYVKNHQTSIANANWTNQVGDINVPQVPFTQSPEFDRIVIPAHSLTAEPSVSLEEIEDSQTNVEALLAEEVGKTLADMKETAFTVGSGVGQPLGLLTASAVGPESITQVAEVAAAGADISADDIIDLTYSIKAQYRRNAMFMCNRNTLAKIRKLKDLNGNYLFEYAAQIQGAGVVGSLLGYPVVENEEMPDTGKVLAFGDFAGYCVVNRVGTTMLRNPFRVSGAVSLFTRLRVGGGILDAQGLRVLTV